MTFDSYLSRNDNASFLKNYKQWRKIMEFLDHVRQSGIVNMFEASPILLYDRTSLDRYFGENMEDNEAFQYLLDNISIIRDIQIQNVISELERRGEEVDIDNANSLMRRNSKRLLMTYIQLYSHLFNQQN